MDTANTTGVISTNLLELLLLAALWGGLDGTLNDMLTGLWIVDIEAAPEVRVLKQTDRRCGWVCSRF